VGAIAWLGRSMFENVVSGWPVALLAVLALVAPVRVLWEKSTDTRRTLTRRAQKGWWFPLALLLVGLALSPFDMAATRVLSIATLVALLGIPLVHLWWMLIEIRGSKGARALVLSTIASQLCVDLLLLMPAIGLATGFGRTWR
jgi:hypothetical protein